MGPSSRRLPLCSHIVLIKIDKDQWIWNDVTYKTWYGIPVILSVEAACWMGTNGGAKRSVSSSFHMKIWCVKGLPPLFFCWRHNKNTSRTRFLRLESVECLLRTAFFISSRSKTLFGRKAFLRHFRSAAPGFFAETSFDILCEICTQLSCKVVF